MTSDEPAHVDVVPDAEAAGGVSVPVEVEVLEAGLAPEGRVLVAQLVVGRDQRAHVVQATLLSWQPVSLVVGKINNNHYQSEL